MFAKRIEERLESGEIRQVYKGVKQLMGAKQSNQEKVSLDFGTQLNTFYARFDNKNFTEMRKEWQSKLHKSGNESKTKYQFEEKHIADLLKQINVNKTPGPDKIHGKTLKYCREELKYPITSLFNTVLRTCRFPMCWKVGEIVPVQKTQTCKSLNDYRPIVLTSVLAKCFEKLVRQILNLETSHHLDDN